MFLCEHPVHGCCALKIFVPQAKPRVDAEITLLRAIDCPTIVTLYECGSATIRDAQCPFTLMEFVGGGSLRDRIQSGDLLSEDQTRQVVKSVSRAIHELWVRKKVHRDIKPDNILIGDPCRPVLIDFGVARHLDLATMTAPGFAPGTRGYKSREHDSAIRCLTFKADVFSLGVTAFESMTGAHPFGFNQEVIDLGPPPPDIRSVVDCGDTFAVLLSQMMHPRAIMRPELAKLMEC